MSQMTSFAYSTTSNAVVPYELPEPRSRHKLFSPVLNLPHTTKIDANKCKSLPAGCAIDRPIDDSTSGSDFEEVEEKRAWSHHRKKRSSWGESQ